MSDYECPYCGFEHEDAWEMRMVDGETAEVLCAACERPILLTLSVSYGPKG